MALTAMWRLRRMRRAALHAAAPAVHALVRDGGHHVDVGSPTMHSRGSAAFGRPASARSAMQRLGAEAAHFLVVAEGVVQRVRQVGLQKGLGLRHHQADEALHVGAAAAIEAAVRPPCAGRRPAGRPSRPGRPRARCRCGRTGSRRRACLRPAWQTGWPCGGASSCVRRSGTPSVRRWSAMHSISGRLDWSLTVLKRTRRCAQAQSPAADGVVPCRSC
jgi:hypothetical protein